MLTFLCVHSQRRVVWRARGCCVMTPFRRRDHCRLLSSPRRSSERTDLLNTCQTRTQNPDQRTITYTSQCIRRRRLYTRAYCNELLKLRHCKSEYQKCLPRVRLQSSDADVVVKPTKDGGREQERPNGDELHQVTQQSGRPADCVSLTVCFVVSISGSFCRLQCEELDVKCWQCWQLPKCVFDQSLLFLFVSPTGAV